MKELVQAKSSTPKQLFSNKYYEVPSFQRLFSWKKDNVNDFWDDITEAKKLKKCHFFGAIVLQSNKRGINNIYDGQQRLTVVASLLAVLRMQVLHIFEQSQSPTVKDEALKFSKRLQRHLFDKQKKVYLRLTEYNRRFFNESILGHYAEAEKQGFKSNDFLYKFVFKNLQEKVSDYIQESNGDKDSLIRLSALYDFVMNKIYFAVIQADKHFPSATLFETLNFRGAQLTTADLFKSILFSKAQTQRCLGEAEILWKDITTDIDRHKLNLTEFLKHHWISINGRLTEGSLYKVLKKDLEKNPKLKVSTYLKRIKSSLAHYLKIINPRTSSNDKSWENLNAINKIGAKDCYPYLLALMDVSSQIENEGETLWSNTDALEFRRLRRIALNQIEGLSLRMLVCKRTESYDVNKIYAVASGLLRDNPIEGLKHLIAQIRTHAPDDTIFQQEFSNFISPSQKISLYVLHKLEAYVRGNREAISENTSKITLEHIMPKKLDKAWKRVERYHKNHLNRIGNLTLLGTKLNKTNATFNRKKNKYYSNSDVAITKALVGQTKWGRNQINDRQKEFAQYALKVWAVKK